MIGLSSSNSVDPIDPCTELIKALLFGKKSLLALKEGD